VLKFQNPACYILLMLVFAHCINDIFTTPILGNIPVTPVQVTIMGSIIYLLIYSRKLTSRLIRSIFVPAYFYLGFIFISTVISYIDTEHLELYLLTLGFNLFLLRLLAPFLVEGFSVQDTRNFVLSLCTVLFFFAILPGSYEFVTRSYILPTKKGLSSNVFYVRGFFTDKLELGTALGIMIFMLILLTESIHANFKRILIFGLTLVAAVLVFFSFSTTAIVGIISGAAVLLFFNIRGIFIKTFFSLLIIYLGYTLVSETNLFEEQVRSYQLKYTLNVERYEEKNFRYLSFVKGLERFLDKPFFGNGVSQSQVIIQEVLGTKKQVNPHNFLVTELIDYGLVGTVFISFFLYRLYKLLRFSIYDYSGHPHVQFFNKLSLALGILVLFRLVLYYHRFDQTIYFFFAALLMTTYGMIRKIHILESTKAGVYENKDFNSRPEIR
jgi:hypothetical protein